MAMFIQLSCLSILLFSGFKINLATPVEENKQAGQSSEDAINEVLKNQPVIDAHNDFPINVRALLYNNLTKLQFDQDMTKISPWAGNKGTHTDLPRLRKGKVGAQFWVAYTMCSSQYKDSVVQAIEQIDLIRRLIKKYPNDLQYASNADEIESSMKAGKIASLIAIEGGHAIQFSMAVLRTFYDLGARYMTLVHNCNTPWADAAPVDLNPPQFEAKSKGLSWFGVKVVHEMNRLGMMVDLSHVSYETMKAAINASKAPIIFSHSQAYEICKHPRNVKDDVIKMVQKTNSIIMVNFYKIFVRCDGKNATIQDVVDHLNYIKDMTSSDHVGIGGDYDGIDQTPEGLEDVSKYPNLFKALYETGKWTKSDLQKLAGGNILRVMRAVEKVRDEMIDVKPAEDWVREDDLDHYEVPRGCVTGDFPSNKVQSDDDIADTLAKWRDE